jgi:hypothetical protein
MDAPATEERIALHQKKGHREEDGVDMGEQRGEETEEEAGEPEV